MCVSVCTYECIWLQFDLTSNVCCTWIVPQHCIYKHQDTRTYMYRQTKRHSGWMSEIRACACMRAYLFPFLSVKTQSYVFFTNVYERICFLFVHFYEHARQLSAHTRTHEEITRTPLSCGGDACDADSLSLLRQSYSNIQTCVHAYIFVVSEYTRQLSA
jgi:hypothetical protein